MDKLKSLKGIEAFAVGTWNEETYTLQDLQEMVNNFNALKGVIDVPLKVGHSDKQEITGKPAMGWISNLYMNGNKLIADIINIPSALYNLIQNKAYAHVSSEIFPKFIDEAGKTYNNVLCGLALLGDEMPAVSSLQSITALYNKKELEVKCYKFDNIIQGGESDMDKIAELQKQLEEKDIAIKKYEAEVAELKTAEVKIDEAKKDIEAKADEIQKLSAELKAIKLDSKTFENDMFIENAIKSEKVMPKQKDTLSSIFKALREQVSPVLKFSVDGNESEKGLSDVIKEYITDSPKLNLLETFSEKQAENEKKQDAREFCSLDEATKFYAEEDKVSYGLGLKKVHRLMKDGLVVIKDKK